jgi:NAD(P)-dependent dehydrogenase (short-subunit alcohol dehydrogenase family)
MKGRVCLVTGATSGIGKEIAAGLASMGATVVVAGRERGRCEAAVAEIRKRSEGSEPQPSYLVADLSSLAEVRRLADEFSAAHDRLDVLVNNAGVFSAERRVTVDDLEYTFAVNHLAPFLLTNLLLGRLRAASSSSSSSSTPAASSRIVTTSSVAHKGASMDFDDLQFERRKYSGLKAYSQSKLANILFTRELARKRLDAGQITANCFHPGAVRTGLVRNGVYAAVWSMAGPFMLTPEKGADTGVYLSSSPEVEGVTGGYFVKRRQVEPSAEAQDDGAAARLWQVSEELTGLR